MEILTTFEGVFLRLLGREIHSDQRWEQYTLTNVTFTHPNKQKV